MPATDVENPKKPPPSRAECLQILSDLGTPENICRHSIAVAAVARVLCDELVAAGEKMDADIVTAAALLHDVGKARCLRNGGDHAKEGASIVIEKGFPVLAPIVRDHASLSANHLASGPNESLVVNYADKRIKHDTLVSLRERFDDLILRYAKSQNDKNLIETMFSHYATLECSLFSNLAFAPEDLPTRMHEHCWGLDLTDLA